MCFCPSCWTKLRSKEIFKILKLMRPGFVSPVSTNQTTFLQVVKSKSFNLYFFCYLSNGYEIIDKNRAGSLSRVTGPCGVLASKNNVSPG